LPVPRSQPRRSGGRLGALAPLRTTVGHNYYITIKAGDIHGNFVNRSVLIRVAAPEVKKVAAAKRVATKKPVRKRPAAKKR
jgi:hypothetical protein